MRVSGKVTAVALAALLAFSLVPAPAFAAEKDAQPQTIQGDDHFGSVIVSEVITEYDDSADSSYSNASGPVLTAGSAVRIAQLMVEITFTSDRAGTRYWQIDGEVPTAEALAGNPLSPRAAMTAGENKFNYGGLSTDEHIIYIAAKDTDGNVSELLSIVIPAFGSFSANTIDIFKLYEEGENDSGANWSYDAALNTITVTGSVKIVGEVHDAPEKLTIIYADSGIEVTWFAVYSTKIPISEYGLIILDVVYDETDCAFVVASGGIIAARDWEFAISSWNNEIVVVVDGGTISSENNCAICDEGAGADVIIKSGAVTASGGPDGFQAINVYGNVTIEGGVVSTATRGAVYTPREVTLAGGEVGAATGTAIEAGGVNVHNGAPVSVSAAGSDPAFRLKDDGVLLVSGHGEGDKANLTVTGDVVISGSGYICVESGGLLTVTGDVLALESNGANVVGAFDSGSVVVINGDVRVIGDDCVGVNACSGGSAAVGGDIIATGSAVSGILCLDGAVVDMTGDIFVTGSTLVGIWNGDSPSTGGTVNMAGSIYVTGTADGLWAEAVYCWEGFVSVTGNIVVVLEDGVDLFDGYYCTAIDNDAGGEVELRGNISVRGKDAYGVVSRGPGKVIVNGCVDVFVRGGVSQGAYTSGGASVTINGDVTIRGDAHSIIGAHAAGSGSSVTVGGAISLPVGAIYIRTGGLYKTREQHETVSSKPGYLEYNEIDLGNTSFVWVRDPAFKGPVPAPRLSITPAHVILKGTEEAEFTAVLAN